MKSDEIPYKSPAELAMEILAHPLDEPPGTVVDWDKAKTAVHKRDKSIHNLCNELTSVMQAGMGIRMGFPDFLYNQYKDDPAIVFAHSPHAARKLLRALEHIAAGQSPTRAEKMVIAKVGPMALAGILQASEQCWEQQMEFHDLSLRLGPSKDPQKESRLSNLYANQVENLRRHIIPRFNQLAEGLNITLQNPLRGR